MSIQTPITELLGIKHPILLAGMNVAAGAKLASAVSLNGGLGVIGGVGYTPEMLKSQLTELKKYLGGKDVPFGVDLLIPSLGPNARKTNKDYTGGKLTELIDIIIESGAKLFVCAVGVPPTWVSEKLHKNGILVMNMIGHPKHIKKALDAGCDMICAQSGDGGGHTGDQAAGSLITTAVDACRGRKMPLNGQPVRVVAAGGVYDGRTLAASLMYGADAVWVGTRFVCAEESGASMAHKKEIVSAADDTVRTIIYTGRPLRVKKNPFNMDWESNRQDEIKELTGKGVLPVEFELDRLDKEGKLSDEIMDQAHPFLMGSVAALIHDIKPAREIINEMVQGAIEAMHRANSMIHSGPKL